jgi:SAM-dependent methyltransferase
MGWLNKVPYGVSMDIRTESYQAASSKPYAYWLKKNWYYHSLIQNFYEFTVPRHHRVLEFGSADGHILAGLQTSFGVGVEADPVLREQAQKKYPHLNFVAGLTEIAAQESFDYVILSNSLMAVDDIQTVLEQLKKFVKPHTRLVIDTYSYGWEPFLVLAEKLGLKRQSTVQHWLSQYDIMSVLNLAGYEVVTSGGQTLVPFYIPGISWFLNFLIAPLPLINRLCLTKWIIARPSPETKKLEDYSVTVVVPCRNERGNIQAAVTRTPVMGKWTEIIFAEGHSKDATFEEIERIAALYPDRNISYFVQSGKGKGQAVRQAFAQAKGDVLMILDADLTVPPEDMPKFFEALIRGKGEFINGSRLIYGMEKQAMRFLNLIANFGFGLAFTWLLNQRIKDTLCGTKVLFKTDYEKIVANRHFFGDFDPYGDFDLLFGAAKLNRKIVDMPVHYRARTYGTSQISRFQGGWLLSRMCIIAWRKLKLRR